MIFSLSRKEKWLLFGKLIVAGAIMIYLFQRFQSFDYSKIFTMQKLQVMGFVCLLTFVNLLIQLSKWKAVFVGMLGKLSNKKLSIDGRFRNAAGRAVAFPSCSAASQPIIA